MKKLSKKMESIFLGFVLVLPAVLYFSYYPLIKLGSSESMNFELSLPIIWLVLFDILVFFLLVSKKKLFKDFGRKLVWLLFPVWLSLTVLWSLNSLRGILTVGILWLLYFAVYGLWKLKGLFDDEFRGRFLKWFFGATLAICGFLILQCVLDLAGVSREYSLMCAGCTSLMFGFPHPNGFAIEPQFMGNLLLAPAIFAAWFIVKDRSDCINFLHSKRFFACFFATVSALFLTFSRGAIYSFLVAMIFMTMFLLVSEQSLRKKAAKGFLKVWGLIILSFVIVLNLQGIMAQVGPTSDTYVMGVSKAINHLSLGIIDIGNRNEEKTEILEEETKEIENELVKNPVENSAEFDGYVAESTDTRLRLSEAGISVWKQSFSNAMFGVGLGGAGQALYVNGLSPAPKEIVQNEYVSLLLETGVIGVSLLIISVVMVVRFICGNKLFGLILCLMVAYGVSMVFFSGLPNSLHIILIPGAIMMVFYSSLKRVASD